ncbi:MAG: hypothetical protein KF795_00585 [Labilithrix sp.]|nr:hypothetical protein [Labilithrix sp.]
MHHHGFRDPTEFEFAYLIPKGLAPRLTLPVWSAATKADYGQPLTPDELDLYRRISGGVDPAPNGHDRILNVFGRRGGKSECVARCLLFEALCVPHGDFLAPGQLGTLAILSPDRAVSCEIYNYVLGMVRGIPDLKKYVEKIRDSHNDRAVQFKTGIEVRILTASTTSVRGPTYVGVTLDELAFWNHSGVDADGEVLDAVSPGLMVSTAAPMRRLWAITSANIKRGLAWEIFEAGHGKADSTWAVRTAPTLLLRPDLTEAQIDRECEGRPAKKLREYCCQFGSASSESFFDAATLAACVDADRGPELPPRRNGARYHVAIDAGFAVDSTAIAVVESRGVFPPGTLPGPAAERVRETSVVYTRAWPAKSLSPQEIVGAIAAVARHFGVTTITGDQHSAPILAEMFSKGHNISLKQRSWHAGSAPDSKAQKFERTRQEMVKGAFRLPSDPAVLASLGVVSAEPTSDGGQRIEKTKGDDLACAIVLAAFEAMCWVSSDGKVSPRAPHVAEHELTPWERAARVDADLAPFYAVHGAGFY